MTPQDFAQATDVSRETLARFETYAALLEKWTARINLVSRSTLPDLWRRHFHDSAQLFDLAPPTARTWIDLGSGAGFPGLVIAILAAEKAQGLAVTLVEADTRKAVFLQTVLRELGIPGDVLPIRIEQLDPRPADVITARALAPLPRLLELAAPFCHPGTRLLLPKGRDAGSELTAARRHWHIECEIRPSKADPDGQILVIESFEALT